MTVRATYRVQLHPGFGFDEVAALAPYLAELGVSHVYLSPPFQAAPGSSHGYDVVDPTRVNVELGGAPARDRMTRELAAHGIGQVVDVVPNHVSTFTPDNSWWWDVLRHGRRSTHQFRFDIEWEPPDPELQGRILLPVLGEAFERAVAHGDVELVRYGEPEEIALRVYERLLPLAPGTFQSTPDATTLARLGGDAAALGELLQHQPYRIAYWWDALPKLNYRRFFDIHELAGLRIEDRRVFDDVHALPLQWIREGSVGGLRIDHPDGLRDPHEYFGRLRREAPHAWIVAEKILVPGEELPRDWPVDGSTGYDFLNLAMGLFVDPDGEEGLNEVYTGFTGASSRWSGTLHDAKRFVVEQLFTAEMRQLVRQLARVCAQRLQGELPANDRLHDTLAEVLACLPVYRTYVRPNEPPGEADVAHVHEALDEARARRPDLPAEPIEMLRAVWLDETPSDEEAELRARIQQLSGPAMAKGQEDTAFYRYARLACLNEVGGDPGRFGTSTDTFHRWCAHVQARWPHTMLATSTHDTKRSEDVRARLVLLSEMPEHWRQTVQRWSARAARYRRDGSPDRKMEYLLYQTMVGAWPISAARLTAFAEKSAREAKIHTSWHNPDSRYEYGVRGWITDVLDDDVLCAEIAQFIDELRDPAHITSLAQTLLKLTAPGIPDLYQGTELWTHTLVDPDNRRPVDFDTRRRRLADLSEMSMDQVWAHRDEGLPKMWLTRAALHVRRRRPEAFGADASYRRMEANGEQAHRLVGFTRGTGIVVLVPRLVWGLREAGWRDTRVTLPRGQWHNVLTAEGWSGGAMDVASLLARFPVALLENTEQEDPS